MNLADLNFRLKPGRSIGAQRGLAEALNFALAVLKGLAGGPGIRITKVGSDWRVVATEQAEATVEPELWDGRISGTALEIYTGVGQPWFVSHDGLTGYLGDRSGWMEIGQTDQDMWITVSPLSSSTATIGTFGYPQYENGTYGVKVGSVVSGQWVKKFSGTAQLPVVNGEAVRDILMWSEDKKEYEQAAPLDEEGTGDAINIGGGSVVSSVVLSQVANKLLKVTKSPLGPSGDTTNVAMKWDVPNAKWIKALPIQSTNDEASAEVGEGDRVVVGAKTGADGNLIQLITKPLGAMGEAADITVDTIDGGTASSPVTVVTAVEVDANDKHHLDVTTKDLTIPDVSGFLESGDFTQLTFITGLQWNATNKTLQIKTRTGYVYSPGTESEWTDTVQFYDYDA